MIEKTARDTYSIASIRNFVRDARQRGAGPAAWNRARTELAVERVAVARLSRQEREGELIPVGVVVAMNTQIVSTVRTRLLTVRPVAVLPMSVW